MDTQYVILGLLMLVSFVGLPLGVAYCLSKFGGVTKQMLVDRFGTESQAVFGGLGVIVHELSHAFVALVFMHKITHITLVRFRNIQQTGQLGSVEHEWNRDNLYENLGNFFIGLAPCFFCSVALWGVHGYLIGNRALTIGQPNLNGSLEATWNNIIDSFSGLNWELLVYIILMIMISCTGYELSDADWSNVKDGLAYWIILLVVIYAGLVCFNFLDPNILSSSVIFCWKAVTLWLSFLGRGLIYIAISWLILKVADQF